MGGEARASPATNAPRESEKASTPNAVKEQPEDAKPTDGDPDKKSEEREDEEEGESSGDEEEGPEACRNLLPLFHSWSRDDAPP